MAQHQHLVGAYCIQLCCKGFTGIKRFHPHLCIRAIIGATLQVETLRSQEVK